MKHHELNLIYALLALIFIIFSMAIVRLYNEQMHLSDMFSSGMMEMKTEMKAIEAQQQNPSPVILQKTGTKSK